MVPLQAGSKATIAVVGLSTCCLQADGRRHGPRYDNPTVRYKGSAVPLDYCKEFGKVGFSQVYCCTVVQGAAMHTSVFAFHSCY